MSRKILLIGGTGILSTDVCRRALMEGYEVYTLNRGKRKYNVEMQSKQIICDVREDNIDAIRQKLDGLYFDAVIDFLSMKEDHVRKAFQIIEDRCNQYVFISTATVYKKFEENEIITENTPIGNDKWEYAANKVRCEQLVRNQYREFCKHYTIIRPYVTYNHMRIPFAIIPPNNWTFINRVMLGKPVLLWNHGEAVCTITNTKDFAVGVVGLLTNTKAYEDSFHITSDFRMTWKEVLDETLDAIGMKVEIADKSIDEIIRYLPEYAGVLNGDKGTNMMFDNEKIKKAVPTFNCEISYHEGIQETIRYFKGHKEVQIVDYRWEGRMDWYMSRFCFRGNREMRKKLTLGCYRRISLKDKYHYLINRYRFLGILAHIVGKYPTSRTT